MKTETIEFKYKGNRKHIHGTDIVNVILRRLEDKKIRNIKCSFHDFIEGPEALIYVSENIDAFNNDIKYKVECSYITDGNKEYIRIEDRPNKLAQHISYEYNESEIIDKCQLGIDCIQLHGESHFSFIETVVAMTKNMHQALSTTTGKWMFTRLVMDEMLSVNDKLRIELRQNLHNRLTKSDMFYNDKCIGQIYFSLVNT